MSKPKEQSCTVAEDCVISRAGQCEMDENYTECVFYKQLFWEKIQEVRRITKDNERKRS